MAGSRRRQKTLALLAGGLVLAAGITVTLAVWNDAEWVTGGVDTDGDGVPDAPGIGTTTFEVQQNTSSPWSATAWADREAAPGGALVFTAGALSLSPGTATYAPVSLTTTDDSVAAASIALSAATMSTAVAADDPDGALFAALSLRVVVAQSDAGEAPAACGAAAFTADSTYVVGGATTRPPLATAGSVVRQLAAAGADRQDYCFEIGLPDGASDALQGLTVAPAWEFVADSVE